METERYPVREDWEEYYKTLEAIRRCGVVNMYGASPVLRECYTNMTTEEANDILVNWMHNYKELNQKYGWRETE